MNRAARLALLVALAAPATARAHEYWLAPSTYAAAAGDTVIVGSYVGMGFVGEPKPWAGARARRFESRGDTTRDLRGGAREGDAAWAAIPVLDGGGTLVAYEGDFAFIELAGTEFDAYLREEGLDAPRAQRATAGGAPAAARERYARCARTWLAGGAPERVTHPTGLTLEIVPARDPAAGGAVPLTVRLRGRPLGGALVRAWRRPLASGAVPVAGAARDSVGPAWAGRTDANGRVVLRVDAPGEWLLSTVHMEACPDPGVADWQSWWASLTFARPARRGR